MTRSKIVQRMLDIVDKGNGVPTQSSAPGYTYGEYKELEKALFPMLSSKAREVYDRGGIDVLTGRYKHVAPGLPKECYIYIPDYKFKMVGVIYKGIKDIDIFLTLCTDEKLLESMAEHMNELAGVTPAQKNAMKYGALTGDWKHPHANPASYSTDGNLLPECGLHPALEFAQQISLFKPCHESTSIKERSSRPAHQKKGEDIKKYELLTKSKINHCGRTLFRIRALTSFTTITGEKVNVGDLGGWIEKESNLSHSGKAWIRDDAKVYDNALVCDSARVFGDARIYGNAKVHGDALVCENAEVCDNARVYGSAWVCGNAWVHGNAQVYGDARVFNEARVYGDARVCGKAWVCGNAMISHDFQ